MDSLILALQELQKNPDHEKATDQVVVWLESAYKFIGTTDYRNHRICEVKENLLAETFTIRVYWTYDWSDSNEVELEVPRSVVEEKDPQTALMIFVLRDQVRALYKDVDFHRAQANRCNDEAAKLVEKINKLKGE